MFGVGITRFVHRGARKPIRNCVDMHIKADPARLTGARGEAVKNGRGRGGGGGI
jgi:hypothetical protein